MALIIAVSFSCKNRVLNNKTASEFHIVQKTIPIIGELEIKNCIKWFIDFKYLKKTVVYRDKIICMGSKLLAPLREGGTTKKQSFYYKRKRSNPESRMLRASQ